MSSKFKSNTIVMMVCTMLTFAGLAWILFMVNTNLEEAINVHKEELDSGQYLIGISHLVVLLFHPFVILYIFNHYRHFRELRTFKVILLIFSVISLFSMGVEKVMVDEIARQLRSGMAFNELTILDLAYIINGTYCLFTLVFLLRTLKLIAQNNSMINRVGDST